MSDTAKPLAECFDRSSSTLGTLLRRARYLAELQHALSDFLRGEPWAVSLRVANVRGNTVVVYSESAAAVTRLKLRSDEVIAFLNERFRLACTRIDAKVRPLPNRPTGGV